MQIKAYFWRRVGALTAVMLIAGLVLATSVRAQPVLPPIAPPKPATARAANALAVSTGDLNESVNWARQGSLVDAATSFNLFKDDWGSIDDEVRGESMDIADQVSAAIAHVDDVLGDADAPPPDQADYYPALQNLQQVVEDANAQLGLIAPATSALRINPANLGQSVTWAIQANLARAHDEYGQFRDDWSLVRDAVRQQALSVADMVDDASARVQAIVSDPARPSPAQSEYLPALQYLQQVVEDANKKLGN